MTKEQIFDDIERFSPEEIVFFIKKGIVTVSELKDTDNTYGLFTAKVRKKVEELLDNAEPNDWNAAVEAGTIAAYQSYLDSYQDGEHREDARKEIRRLEQEEIEKQIEQKRKEEEKANQQKQETDKVIWNEVDKKSRKSLERFIDDYPENFFIKDAKDTLADLENAKYTNRYGMEPLIEAIVATQADKSINDPHRRILELIKEALVDKSIEIDDLLDEIDKDNNFLNAWVIKELVKAHHFSYVDLEDIGIREAFMQKMAGSVQRTKFDEPSQLSKISRKSTEVYFWGIPSSGKSCALGAILSVAGNGRVAKTMMQDPDCQGFDYMNRLPQCFQLNDRVSVLPEGTPTISTYEMGFDLTDKDDKVHPITCIDFAGELIKCMYKKFAHKPLTNQEETALQTLTDVLEANRTENRKMHFFVVEYGAENRLYEGLPQLQYLNAALNYIKQTNIFRTSTDAVYLIVTKVDKIKAKSSAERNELLTIHVQEHYRSFYYGLKQICQQNQINGGVVQILPFSLGKVCFQNYCIFKEAPAESVVDIIMSRSYGYRVGNRGKAEKIFRG